MYVFIRILGNTIEVNNKNCKKIYFPFVTMETASAIWGVNCATTSFTILEASNEDEDNPNCPEDRDQRWVNKKNSSAYFSKKKNSNL